MIRRVDLFSLLVAAGTTTLFGATEQVRAATITQSAIAPIGAIIAQPTSGGSLNGGQDYSNNTAPAQTFTTTSTGFTLDAVTALTAGGYGQFTSATVFYINIEQVVAGKLKVLDAETTQAFKPTTVGTYLTLTLGTPVALAANTQYAYSISTYTPGPGANNYAYIGFAKSSTDVYAGGTALTDVTTDPGIVGNSDSTGNIQPDDRVFYLQAAPVLVPEPASLSILVVGGMMLLRRKARTLN
jgi:hypothetical protein